MAPGVHPVAVRPGVVAPHRRAVELRATGPETHRMAVIDFAHQKRLRGAVGDVLEGEGIMAVERRRVEGAVELAIERIIRVRRNEIASRAELLSA